MKISKVVKSDPYSNVYDVFNEDNHIVTTVRVHSKYVGGGRTETMVRIPYSKNPVLTTQQMDGIARRIDSRNRLRTVMITTTNGTQFYIRFYSH